MGSTQRPGTVKQRYGPEVPPELASSMPRIVKRAASQAAESRRRRRLALKGC
jgi:hypothetical protein